MKSQPRKKNAKAGRESTPNTVAAKVAAMARADRAARKKKMKEWKEQLDLERAELPAEARAALDTVKSGDLDRPEGDAERFAEDLADRMFRSTTAPTLPANGRLDMMDAARQRGFFLHWAENPLDWLRFMEMAEIGECAAGIVRAFLASKGKRAFVIAFTEALAHCLRWGGSFAPSSEKLRIFQVVSHYRACVRHYRRNVRRVEFCDYLKASAKASNDKLLAQLAKQFEPRGQGVTRYAKPQGIKFLAKKGYRLGGK